MGTFADSTVATVTPAVALAALLEHARRFGPEGMVGGGQLLGRLDRAILLAELASLDRGHGHSRRRRSLEDTRAAIWQLHERGLVVGAIADTLGISEATVRRRLGESRTALSMGRQPAWLSGANYTETVGAGDFIVRDRKGPQN